MCRNTAIFVRRMKTNANTGEHVVRLSVVIITFNEEQNIGRCIDSVTGLADEILVVDSFSTDRTESICKEKGARFIQHRFEGYILQKNYALHQARFDHILSLDADEALSEELKSSIHRLKTNWQKPGYAFNRRTNFCGTWVNHAGWYPDTKVRLFIKGSGQWEGLDPHDEYRFRSTFQVERLTGDLFHYSYTSLSGHLQQIDRFSRIGAAAMYAKGKRTTIIQIFLKPFFRFFKHYILQRGFLDGMTGFIISKNSAFGVYLKHVYLYHLQQGKQL
jgi:glycosyltransferase involved in cell wall biosynthesis